MLVVLFDMLLEVLDMTCGSFITYLGWPTNLTIAMTVSKCAAAAAPKVDALRAILRQRFFQYLAD